MILTTVVLARVDPLLPARAGPMGLLPVLHDEVRGEEAKEEDCGGIRIVTKSHTQKKRRKEILIQNLLTLMTRMSALLMSVLWPPLL